MCTSFHIPKQVWELNFGEIHGKNTRSTERSTTQLDQNLVFQTLVSNTADGFYKSFLQECRSLGTRQNLLSRPKVNKHPKRQKLWRIKVFDRDAEQTWGWSNPETQREQNAEL